MVERKPKTKYINKYNFKAAHPKTCLLIGQERERERERERKNRMSNVSVKIY